MSTETTLRAKSPPMENKHILQIFSCPLLTHVVALDVHSLQNQIRLVPPVRLTVI
jgi:hypothetical protein